MLNFNLFSYNYMFKDGIFYYFHGTSKITRGKYGVKFLKNTS